MLILFGVVAAISLPLLSVLFPQLRAEVVVGIDLGTTFSVIGVCSGGRVHILDLGKAGKESNPLLLPSYVSFLGDGKVLVGQPARDAQVNHSRSTIYDAKRLIGRGFADPVVQEELGAYPFRVVERPYSAASQGGEANDYTAPFESYPVFEVPQGGERRLVSPTDVGGIILHELVSRLEDWMPWRRRLGWRLRAATISIPANFDAHQRLATIEAGRRAGLTTVQLITEPAAAALAYRLDNEPGVGHVMVYDFGGGTLDVALLLLDKDIFQVVSTAGDPHLGGEDFDRLLTRHLVSLFREQTGIELPCAGEAQTKSGAPGGSSAVLAACALLRRHAETVKVQLSAVEEVAVTIDNVFEGKPLQVRLGRAEFETMAGSLFQRALAPVGKVLEQSGTALTEVSDVVLVGGSSRLRKVRADLIDYFKGYKVNIRHDVDPDQAIAWGATLTQKCV